MAVTNQLRFARPVSASWFARRTSVAIRLLEEDTSCVSEACDTDGSASRSMTTRLTSTGPASPFVSRPLSITRRRARRSSMEWAATISRNRVGLLEASGSEGGTHFYRLEVGNI